ncbi:hypothetical protein BJ742DRAFT_712100 [Cladochytrium replicatum]|nr:hypothetical protein BJ742DRAFT_712100 [Cladochytrium replicatum]
MSIPHFLAASPASFATDNHNSPYQHQHHTSSILNQSSPQFMSGDSPANPSVMQLYNGVNGNNNAANSPGTTTMLTAAQTAAAMANLSPAQGILSPTSALMSPNYVPSPTQSALSPHMSPNESPIVRSTNSPMTNPQFSKLNQNTVRVSGREMGVGMEKGVGNVAVALTVGFELVWRSSICGVLRLWMLLCNLMLIISFL